MNFDADTRKVNVWYIVVCPTLQTFVVFLKRRHNLHQWDRWKGRSRSCIAHLSLDMTHRTHQILGDIMHSQYLLDSQTDLLQYSWRSQLSHVHINVLLAWSETAHNKQRHIKIKQTQLMHLIIASLAVHIVQHWEAFKNLRIKTRYVLWISQILFIFSCGEPVIVLLDSRCTTCRRSPWTQS